MNNWIPYPLELRGENILLKSYGETDLDDLLCIAADKRIWEYYAVDGSDTGKLKHSFLTAIEERNKNLQYPFVIVDKHTKQVIGSTRFLDLQPQHKKLEIGWTWLHPSYWGTPVNPECKLLLLSYCFEVLNTYRVQLKTDVLNIRSRTAIEKIGAKFEGIFRNDMVRDNNTKRDSAYYSITNEEWEAVKSELLRQLFKR
ncbi:MAG TPA: GNAT family protein [Flavipsychrobacter sp.]|nr:GNAT family protein [Flavipsychrobacter sp.]